MQNCFFRCDEKKPGRTRTRCLFFRQLTCFVALAAAAAASAPALAQEVETRLLFDNVGSTNASHPDKLITVNGVEQNRLGFLTGQNSAGTPVSQVEIRNGVQLQQPGVGATEYFVGSTGPNAGIVQRFRAGDNFTTLHFGSTTAFNLSRLDTYLFEELDTGFAPGVTPTSGFQGLYIAIFQDTDPSNPNQNPPTSSSDPIIANIVAGGFGDPDVSDGFDASINNRLITSGEFAPEFVGYRYRQNEDFTRSPIFRLSADLSDITLTPGNYFISISAVGSEVDNAVRVVPFTPIVQNPGLVNETIIDPYRVPNPDISPTDPFGMAQPNDGPGTIGNPNDPAVANALISPNNTGLYILFDADNNVAGHQGVEIPFELFGTAFVMPEPGTVALMLTGGVPVLGMVLRRVVRRRRQAAQSGEEAA